MDSDQYGYGGGVVYLLAKKSLTIGGEVSAAGGSMSEKDYTMIAGGAGGTIALVGKSINLMGTLNVKGGLSSDEVTLR